MSRIGELAKATLEQKYLLILTRVHRKAGFWSTLAYIEGMPFLEQSRRSAQLTT